MVEQANVVTGIVTIMRERLGLFSSDIGDDDLRPIAETLVKMIRCSGAKKPLDQYVGSELNKLVIAPNPYAEIVDEACALVSNAPS